MNLVCKFCLQQIYPEFIIERNETQVFKCSNCQDYILKERDGRYKNTSISNIFNEFNTSFWGRTLFTVEAAFLLEKKHMNEFSDVLYRKAFEDILFDYSEAIFELIGMNDFLIENENKNTLKEKLDSIFPNFLYKELFHSHFQTSNNYGHYNLNSTKESKLKDLLYKLIFFLNKEYLIIRDQLQIILNNVFKEKIKELYKSEDESIYLDYWSIKDLCTNGLLPFENLKEEISNVCQSRKRIHDFRIIEEV